MSGLQKVVLLVDDEPDILRVLTYFLSNAGYRVVQAHGTEDAIRKVGRYPVDIVLTDLAMPGLSGVHLIEHLRQNPDTMKLPIVAVTAFTWDHLGRSAADYGVDGFVNKPVDRATLLQAVERALHAHTTN